MCRRVLLLLIGVLCAGLPGRAAEVIPPPPANHFNDYAGIVSGSAAAQLEQELTAYERDSSNQILVVIYPRMQSDSSIEDYTVRIAQSWKVGKQDRKNGAVLFIFSQDRKLFIQVGYGLEGVLPDARCKQIVENEIVPRFRQGDFTGGVAAGTRAIVAATKGEYQGSGRTVREGLPGGRQFGGAILFIVMIAFLVLTNFRRRRTFGYRRGGRFFPVYTGGSNWGGGRSGGGGGGGSFSGGGGSFGGGGAGGSW